MKERQPILPKRLLRAWVFRGSVMYLVRLTPEAEAQLGRLDRPIAQRIFVKLRWLAQHFDETQPKSLTGQLGGIYKLRVGDYRVLYNCSSQEQVLIVHFIGHRRDIYKPR